MESGPNHGIKQSKEPNPEPSYFGALPPDVPKGFLRLTNMKPASWVETEQEIHKGTKYQCISSLQLAFYMKVGHYVDS